MTMSRRLRTHAAARRTAKKPGLLGVGTLALGGVIIAVMKDKKK